MKVIVDASNVAHYKKNEDSEPMLSNILAAVKTLEEKKDDFVLIADASLRYDIDEKDKYQKLLDDESIEEVPSGNNADHFICKIADEENAKILSNDKFRDFKDEFQNISSMRMPFTFDGDKLVIGKAKQPKKDKHILQNICEDILNQFDKKRWEVYTGKNGKDLTPLNIAKQAIIMMDKSNDNSVGTKIEGLFSKLPMFDKLMEMVDDIETAAPYVIFVLVHPRDYKIAVKNAGTISVTVADRLRLDKKPLIAVRNDLFTKPGTFNLHVLTNDDVMDVPPFNIDIRIDGFDETFIKKNSRNIASTVAGRIGSWKFPFVTVKPDIMLEKPGEFQISLEKGGKPDG